MATHSSVLAWRIPGTREPGGLLSMGSHRVGHDWSDLAAVAACWKVTGTSWPDLCGQMQETKDSGTKKLAMTNHTPSCFNTKQAWIWTQIRWLFGALVHHLLSLLALHKVIFPCPNNSSLKVLNYHKVSSRNVDSVIVAEGVNWNQATLLRCMLSLLSCVHLFATL